MCRSTRWLYVRVKAVLKGSGGGRLWRGAEVLRPEEKHTSNLSIKITYCVCVCVWVSRGWDDYSTVGPRETAVPFIIPAEGGMTQSIVFWVERRQSAVISLHVKCCTFFVFLLSQFKKKKKNRNKKKNVHSVSWTVDGDTNTALETEASPKKHSPDYLVFHNKTSNQTARILLNTRTRPKHEWKSVSSFEDSVAGSSSAFFEQMCPLLSQNKEQTTERKKKKRVLLVSVAPAASALSLPEDST